MGADIVNGSYGGFPWSRFEYDALRALGRDDVLAVFAAGNAGADYDVPGVTRWKGKWKASAGCIQRAMSSRTS
jgi:hypothetical protein